MTTRTRTKARTEIKEDVKPVFYATKVILTPSVKMSRVIIHVYNSTEVRATNIESGVAEDLLEWLRGNDASIYTVNTEKFDITFLRDRLHSISYFRVPIFLISDTAEGDDGEQVQFNTDTKTPAVPQSAYTFTRPEIPSMDSNTGKTNKY